MKRILYIFAALPLVFSGCARTFLSENSDYYPIIREKDSNVVFNMDINEFIDNYNNESNIHKLNSNNFEAGGFGTLWFNPIEAVRYMDTTERVEIMVGTDNNSYITGVMLMQDSTEDPETIVERYTTVIQAMNPDYTRGDAENISYEFVDYAADGIFSDTIYQKGMIFYYQINSDYTVFGVEAITEDQYSASMQS